MTNRRQFLQTAFYSSLIYGTGMLPKTISTASAAPLANKLLVNVDLDGGPDFRHFIVPAYDSTTDSYGQKYWKNRWRAHRIGNNQQAWRNRWNNDYYHITVGADNWPSGLVDSGDINNGITFGIWKEAGWLIDMFRQGHVAFICNAVGGTNRAHDLSSLMLKQGNVLTTLNNRDYSGWGGRLARSAQGNLISLTNTPSPFCFGPTGNAPNYNPGIIDNRDLVSVNDTRSIGLYDVDFNLHQTFNTAQKMARASKSYYAALRQEAIPAAYEKFMDHESKVRTFGELIKGRLDDIEIPELIQALYDGVDGINDDPNNGEARRVLSGYGFGEQIRNLYDVIVSNDLLDAKVISMVGFRDWDSHAEQRITPNGLSADPNNPELYRGVESSFKNLFGGRFGPNPVSPSSTLHGGFSALWQNLNQADRDKIAITIAGEFGRQLRDNGDAGTDHGTGNIMMVISEQIAGGVYGELFPEVEVDKYDDASLFTPDIDPRTDIDPIFSSVCNWHTSSSGNVVFPRMNNINNNSLPEEQVPRVETGISLANLF